MSNISLAVILAFSFLAIAGIITITPVKSIEGWIKRQNLRQPYALDERSEKHIPDETLPRGLRQEVASTLVRAYLHDRATRDHLQIAAAAQNLNPIGPGDVLTQLIFVRRDLNRILRESSNPRPYQLNTSGLSRPEYFRSMSDLHLPKSDPFTIKYFQENIEIADLENIKTRASFHRKKSLKRKSGVFE